jgi:hypothetical protein
VFFDKASSYLVGGGYAEDARLFFIFLDVLDG